MDGRDGIESLSGEPVLAVCGFSGAGKTTLLEAVIPRLVGRGLAVAVVKHDAHGLHVDRPGKDSDRLYRVGADVVLRGPDESLCRRHGGVELVSEVLTLLARHDLVLVEGHKRTPLAKVWLEHPAQGGSPGPPCETGPGDLESLCAVLAPGDGRQEALLAIVEERLAAAHAARPLCAGILVGGRSERMGRPKQLLEVGGESMLDRAARAIEPFAGRPVALGAGPLPAAWAAAVRLPDPPGLTGPAAGLLAALRWAPRTSWLLAPCDLPRIHAAAVAWLVEQRRPGRWAVLPSLDGVHPEPLLAVYEPQARSLLEREALTGGGPSRLAGHPRTALVEIPEGLRDAWRDADTPGELPPSP